MLLPPNIVLWTIKIILNPKFRIFLEALRKAGYSESTIRQYKKTCRLFIVYMDINYIQDCNVESIDLIFKDYATSKKRG